MFALQIACETDLGWELAKHRGELGLERRRAHAEKSEGAGNRSELEVVREWSKLRETEQLE